MSEAALVKQYRRFLLVLSAFIFAGSIVELEFIEHYESTMQLVPFVLVGAGLIGTLAALYKPNAGQLRTLRYLMLPIFAGGLLGMYQHLEHNFEFAREISPNLSTMGAFWEALYGASPLLAPGILCLGAILVYAATWRHPMLKQTDPE